MAVLCRERQDGGSTRKLEDNAERQRGGEGAHQDGNKGKAEVTVNTATGKVCWEFTLAKIDGKPTQAHIHLGKAGVSGNVVVPLGGSYKRQGCTNAAKSLVKAILNIRGRTT